MPNFNKLRFIGFEIYDNSQLFLTDPRNLEFPQVSICKFFYLCPFDCTTVAESEMVGPIKQADHTNLMIVDISVDRPKLVHICCVITSLWHLCGTLPF